MLSALTHTHTHIHTHTHTYIHTHTHMHTDPNSPKLTADNRGDVENSCR